MDISTSGDIADLDSDEFDRLDDTAGPSACYGRLRQREADGRWHVSYVRLHGDGRLRAAVPLYVSRMRSWPDPAYDPGGWDLPEPLRSACGPATALLVGGCSDRRTGLHADEWARAPARLRRLLAAAARLAAEQGRCLVFPYFFADARAVLAAATGDRIAWTGIAREARMRGLADPDRQRRLGSKVRYVLRRDRRLIDAESLVESQAGWPEVESWAAAAIAAQNSRKGRADLADFVKLRHHEWQRCPSVDLTTFVVHGSSTRGVLTVLNWRDQLELYEVGLTGEDGPERLAAYLDLLFHLPVAFATRCGITSMRLGFEAETAKSARGAQFDELYGGVLDHRQTRELADEHA